MKTISSCRLKEKKKGKTRRVRRAQGDLEENEENMDSRYGMCAGSSHHGGRNFLIKFGQHMDRCPPSIVMHLESYDRCASQRRGLRHHAQDSRYGTCAGLSPRGEGIFSLNFGQCIEPVPSQYRDALGETKQGERFAHLTCCLALNRGPGKEEGEEDEGCCCSSSPLLHPPDQSKPQPLLALAGGHFHTNRLVCT
ncbi:hypothetical protein ANN_18502 [Periplaneta americana]|uniref:Uncharacterized protein n=1 Tax=Periplaneta americana TaxID=6978 RepID=A0ABQ8SNX7_PERAM|nr:hypothetical protein ANN_18502 [Periplaneta americana]